MLARFATARTVSSPTVALSSSASAASKIRRRVRSLCRSTRLKLLKFFPVDMRKDAMSDCMTSAVVRQSFPATCNSPQGDPHENPEPEGAAGRRAAGVRRHQLHRLGDVELRVSG